MTKASTVRNWMFRALMFEANAQHLRDAGFRVGADNQAAEQTLLGEVLAPFPVAIRNNAMRMVRLYALFHCFENSVRLLIEERMLQAFGANWWEEQVPPKIKGYVQKLREDADMNLWLDGERTKHVDFLLFGQLADIMISKWDCFSDLIPTQHWLKQRFDELEKVRNFLAHNRVLSEGELDRVEMYISDWNRQVGF